jgi:GT2 family glycosyltransferase
MIAVIIPNLNGKKFLKTCLDSLLNQVLKDFEIIIVDNGSVDGSVSFIEENYPEARVIPLEENRGFSVAVNVGIRHSKGEYIALLNNDTEVDPNWLSELKKSLDKHPEVGFCASKLLFWDRRDVINSAGDSVSVSGYASNIGFNHKDGEGFNLERKVFGACAAAAIYRKEMFEHIGLFDEDYFAYYEDVDLGLRAQLNGYQCLYVPTAVVYHRASGTTNRGSDFVIFHTERNVLYNIVKDIPLSMMIRFPLKIAHQNLYKFLLCLMRGQFPVWMDAKLSALPHLFRMYRKRIAIQRSRTVSIQYLLAVFKRGKIPWF